MRGRVGEGKVEGGRWWVYGEGGEGGMITIRRSVGAFVVDDEEIIKKSKLALTESINNDYIDNLKLASISLDEALELLKKSIK